ncbi:cytochrome c oxidase assembly protein [soil metagenome]
MFVPLHVGFAENPGFGSWQFEPTVVIGVALAGFLYFRWIRQYERRHPGEQGASTAKQVSFGLGLATFVIALLSPVDVLGSYLLTMHMTQHILLTIVGPPLLLAGLSASMVQRWTELGRAWDVWRILTKPVVAFILFNALFSLMHLPVFYNVILRNEIVHIATHLTLIGAALLSWWSVLAPGRQFGELSQAMKGIYLLAHTVPGQIVGAIITFASASSILYVEYTHAPERVWGLSLTTDQEIGGLLMWIGVGTFYMLAAGVGFYRWADEADSRERSRITKPKPVQ